MKIFEKDDKVNFVDKNNVFVGYDLACDCCEYADWYISDKRETDCRENTFDENLSEYVFDKNFFEKEKDGFDGDDGGMVRFKLVANEKPDIFLHIFNSHNGYYSHGFEAKIDGIDWQNGYI